MKTLFKKLVKGILASILFFSLHNNSTAQTGQCLNLDGANDYVQASSISFGTNWTAEAWIYPTNLFGNWNSVLGQCFYNNNQGFVIAVQSGSVFVDSPLMGGAISTSITSSVWTHVAVTYNNGIYAFYKNGILVGSKAAAFVNSTNPFLIGIRSNNNNVGLIDPYQGNLDEIRIWNVTRSQCDIQRFMSAEIPTTSAGLVANYHFNEGIANSINFIPILLNNNTLTDVSGSGNHGTLFGFGLSLGGSFSNWTMPGSPAQGNNTPASASTAAINISGNGNNIIDGSVTTTTLNHTSFGTSGTRTFVIQNTGSQTLNVGTPVITGLNASEFSITVIPSPFLAATTGTSSFVVAFTPTVLGNKSATLNIYNSECTKIIYDFVITATAVTGAALNFDGLNDFIETGANLAELGNADFSIEAWIRTTGTSEAIVTCANANASWEVGEKCFYIDGGGTPMFVGWGNNYIVGNVTVNNGIWHHVAVVWDYSSGSNGVGKMYVDGVDHTSGTTSYAGNNTNVGTFKIGRANFQSGEATNNFAGDIDEVRIWNRVLCLPEIVNNMNCELPNPTTQAGLNGYYKLNTGIAFGTNTSALTAADAAVFTNNGTLTNFSLTGGTNSNWITPGGVTSGSTCSAYLDPEINIQGNGISIVNLDITASLTDHTDFGTVIQGSVLSRTFVIQNVGTAPLTIGAYSLSGLDATSFTITTNPSASLAPAASTSIIVSYSATTLGLKTASLTIVNNDCDEGVYCYVINATAVLVGAALDFDGTNDVVQITGPVFGTGDFTMEGWLKPATTSTLGGFIISSRFNEGFQTGNWWTLHCGADGGAGRVIALEVAESGFGPTAYQGFNSTYSITSGTWNHFAVVRTGLKVTFYINGNFAGTYTETFLHNLDNTSINLANNVNIGGWPQNLSSWYRGVMDELRLWTVARTQCEIQTFMNCEIPTTSTGLVANYHFNQGLAAVSNPTVTSLIDATANHTGTLSNFALTSTISNWVSPSQITNGYSIAVAPSASIALSGNSNNIPIGSSTSTNNFTDFGSASTRNYVIQNSTGTGTLYVNSVTLNGANAGDFTLSTLPASSITTASTNFVITFTPTALGTRSAIVTVNSSDCANPNYSFVITASTSPASALRFDGINDIVYTSLNCDNDVMPVTTWEAWIYPTTNDGIYRQILSIDDGSWDRFVAMISGSFVVGVGSGPWMPITIDLNQWQHIAVTFSGTTVKFYKNGVEYNSTTSYLTGMTTANLAIGARSGPAQDFFRGSVDEVRVWNIIRSQCEIQTFMNCEIPTTAAGLVANYHFNQGIPSGSNTAVTTLIDATGSNTGTLTNMALTGSISNWVSPSQITNGYTIAVAPTSSISLSGNGNNIPIGSSTSTNNFTDFGSASARNYMIQNSTGTGTLYVNSVTLSGANAGDFTISALPASAITTGSTNFVITFTPTALGTRSAIVNINSSDCANPNYSFVITASASPASALAFDRTGNNRIITNSSFNINNQSFSVEFWAKRTSTLSGYVVGKGTVVNTNQALHIGFRPGNVFTFAFYNNDVNYTTTATSDGVYHHWACVYDAAAVGTNRFVYLDGTLVFSDYTANGLNTSGPLIIGDVGHYTTFPNPLTGTVDEVRIWGVARSQCEIQDHMHCEIATTAPGLVANYHFNHGVPSGPNSTFTVLTDAAGTNTGTLTNFSLSGSTSNWVDPGGVTSNSTCPLLTYPEIDIQGNSVSIVNSSTLANPTDFTEFNNAFIGSTATRTFVIKNNGLANLSISNYSLSGINAADFSITSAPAAIVAPSGSTSIVITFSASSIGQRNATVNIINNDCDENAYTFVVQSKGIALAEALNFDGIDDHIAVNNLLDPLSTNYSLEMWFKIASDVNRPTLIKHAAATGTGRSHLYVSNTAHTIGSNTGGTALLGTTTITPGQWYHVAYTWNGTTRKIYLNGVLEAQQNITLETSTGSNWRIGVNAANNFFDGIIDELRVWNTERSQCDIQKFMNCEIPNNATNLIANYHFNQGIAGLSNFAVTTLTDATTAMKDGTLSNFALTSTVSSNWIISGAVVSGFTTTTIPAATIAISGNGNNVPIGVLTTTNNFTDFGTAFTRTFVIQNAGTGTLYVNAPILLSGVNATDFSITTQPSSSITTGTSNFVINFMPTAIGSRSAVVTINSSDCTVPNYSFVITASATIGEALSFDGINDLVTGPILSTYTSGVTMQAKIYWRGTTGISQMICYNGNSGTNGYGIYNTLNTNTISFLFGGISFYPFNYTLTPNQWTSLSLVIKNSIAECYANGILTNTVVIPAPGVPSSGIFAIGNNNIASEPFNGSIDEILFWNRPLSACEIQANLNCEVATSATSLTANYHFNEGIANGINTLTLLNDASGNTNNLTLSNFTLSGLTSNWINQGAVISGSSCPAYFEPDINVLGNAMTITIGDLIPSTSDDTDFGNISTTSVTVKTYTIQNTGNGPLTVSSITMNGADASMFLVGPLTPASPIASNSFAVFSVTFAPNSVGTKSATIHISNNDCDEAVYNYVLTGTSNPGESLNFDGTNDYVNCGNILTPSYTKEAWVKIAASTNGNNFLSGGSGSNGHALWAPGIYSYKLSAGHDLNWSVVQDPISMSFGIWYHVAVTYDAPSKVMTLYKNGISVASNTILPYSGTDPLSIGAFGTTFPINGSMDEVRIWNRALCPTEIQNNMSCQIPTTASGLIANYHFNQGIAYGSNLTNTLVTDASGSANTGTFVGIAATGTVSNWQSPGAVTTGSSCAIITIPEINVVGNNTTIIDGSTNTSLTNHTDFASVCIGNLNIRTYTIQNLGAANLTVSGIILSGINASDFVLGALTPGSPIPPSGFAVFSVTFTPSVAGNKTATVTIANNDCNESPYDFVITGTCNALPIVVANTTNSVICNTFSTSVFGGGANTYTWTGGVNNNIAFTPSTTMSYSVSGTNTLTGCTSTNLAVQTITVNPTPSISASQSTNVICFGSSIDLIASGVTTYTWEPGSLNNASVNVTPSITTTYSVSGTSSAGCVASNTVALPITVNPLPVVTATTSDPVICLNYTTSLIGAGANTYTWSTGVTNGVAFSPTITQSYTVNGTNTLTGCTSTNSAVQTITVNSLPTVFITVSNSVICEGSSTSLTASGANTYTWNPGNIQGLTLNTSPSLTTTYTLNGTSIEGCTSTNVAVQTISVNSIPIVTASISNSMICAGNTVSLNGSGANTYTWSNGVSDGVAFTPSVSNTFTLTGTNSAGCTNTNLATTSVTVNNLPFLNVSVLDSVICVGDTTNLTASGANTYTWSGGINNGVDFTPSNSISYTVSAEDLNSCKNTAVVSITVNSLPELTISSTQNPACIAQSQTISVSGALTYTWNTLETNSSFNFTPQVASVFSVLATDLNGCINSASYNQNVMTCEIIVFSGVTANNDGLNDVLTIQNIESFPENKVSVFNRWGKEIFSIKGYNNQDKAWPLPEDVSKLTPTTYFYIIDLGDGSKLIKGWVELLKN